MVVKRSGSLGEMVPLIESPILRKLSSVEVEKNGLLGFGGSDTQYATHCLHTYLAAMIPQLAKYLIDTYVPENGSVFDPFCGGGAVLVEAILNGRKAVGCDINDLAVLVSKAKTKFIYEEEIERVGKEVIEKAGGYSGPEMEFKKSDFVDFWFKPYMLLPLTGLRKAIDEIEKEDLKTLFKVLFSATVRNVSLTYRNEIRLRRMSKDEQEKFNPDVLVKFKGKLSQAIERVPSLPKRSKVRVDKMDTRFLTFSENEFDAIVCSPPYGDERNGVPYIQFAKNMLYWLGYSREDLMGTKELTLGWGKRSRTVPPSRTLISRLEDISKYTSSVREAIAFYADYFDALKQMARVTRQRIIIVIGKRVLQNTIFDNGTITAELMADVGVPLEKNMVRSLPTKRLPRMREFGAAINEENILVFKKGM